MFVKVMEDKSASVRLAQAATLALSRAALIGMLGAIAVVGGAFLGFQKAAWILLGVVYAALGLAYLGGKVGWIMLVRMDHGGGTSAAMRSISSERRKDELATPAGAGLAAVVVRALGIPVDATFPGPRGARAQ